MKANAPEKINLPVKDGKLIGLIKDDGLPFKNCDENIEYTRTAAFTEKAAEWIKNKAEKYIVDTPLYSYFDYKRAVEDFLIYMKGE